MVDKGLCLLGLYRPEKIGAGSKIFKICNQPSSRLLRIEEKGDSGDDIFNMMWDISVKHKEETVNKSIDHTIFLCDSIITGK